MINITWHSEPYWLPLTPVFSVIVGSFLGFLSSFLLFRITNIRRLKEEKASLELSISLEILLLVEKMEQTVELCGSQLSVEFLEYDRIKDLTQVYRANCSKIGYLDNETIQVIIKFYSRISLLNSRRDAGSRMLYNARDLAETAAFGREAVIEIRKNNPYITEVSSCSEQL